MAVSTAASAGPPPTVMVVKDNKFKPDSATQPLFDGSSGWNWRDDVEREHNVRQDSKLFYSGAPTDDPSTSYVTYASAGTYHYFCEVHGSRRGGMDGIIKTKPIIVPTSDTSFNVHWAQGTSTGDQFDVRYRVGTHRFKRFHTNTALKSDAFVGVAGKTYTFQARSELSSNPRRRSGWSPKVVVEQ